MATVWSPAPYYKRHDWLYTDGTIVQEPPIETTSSARRWRIAGTTMSVPKHELDDKITHYMRQNAKARGTDVWMRLLDETEELKNHSYSVTGSNDATFLDKAAEPKLGRNKSTYVAFEFKHPTYPLRAVMWAVLTINYNWTCTISTSVTYRLGDPLVPSVTEPAKIGERQRRRYDAAVTGQLVGGIPMENVNFNVNPRKAMGHFLDLLLKMESLDSIELPDGRQQGATLTYEFSRTNYSQELYRILVDKVQEGPAIERLSTALKNVKRELANLGFVVGTDFDLNDLTDGKLHELAVKITPHEDNDANEEGIDQAHTVVIDLARGVCFVECSRKKLEEVAEQWNVAKFKAELTGQVDELLAYAEAYNMASEQKRLRKIIRQRAIEDS